MDTFDDLSSSMEDYLEAIYHIVKRKQAAKAIDIARKLNVKNSSVTGALRLLSEKGYINYAPYDLITLTEKGADYAKSLVRKHKALRDFFVNVLGAEALDAEETACKMEHVISPTILERLIRFVEFVEMCPRGGEEWLRRFDQVCEETVTAKECERCILQCLDHLKKAGLPTDH